jgi:UDP-N-acetylmuramoylalanine--D-glutamate ligase
MIEQIIEFLKNKKIIILGFGVEGQSTYNFIRRYLPNVPLVIRYSKSDFDKEREYLEKDTNLQFLTGNDYLKGIEEYDVILKSPGISFKDIDISKFKNKIYSQLELFLEYTKSFTIGVTGTKGKSTTSSLIYEMLVKQNKDAELLGNIGVPIFDEIEKINDDTIVVLEMSSHGLQYTDKSPNISILLNVFEEHLDHYKSFEEYRDAKFNIFKFQGKKDIAIFNLDNKEMEKKKYQYRENDYGITINNIENTNTNNTIYKKDDYIYLNDKKIYATNEERKLKGNHNLNDIMFVLAVSNILNLDLPKTIKTINEFNPLEHRLEFVGTFDGVDYYNDSIATIPEAAIESVKALENVNTLIVGGNNRGVNQENLIKFLKESKIENILCLPKTGEYIYDGLIKTDKNIVNVKDMEEAVRIAKKVTKKNTICLLSPAASSYGYFKNFKERGNIFKELVKK